MLLNCATLGHFSREILSGLLEIGQIFSLKIGINAVFQPILPYRLLPEINCHRFNRFLKSMQNFQPQRESKHGRMTLDWVAVALSVIVLFAPVTSMLQIVGGSEIVDVESEECSVEAAESVHDERQRRESPDTRVARLAVCNAKPQLSAQLRSRITERDSLNGTGGWLRL